MVQEELMRQGFYKVAESYILYRAQRTRMREEASSPRPRPSRSRWSSSGERMVRAFFGTAAN